MSNFATEAKTLLANVLSEVTTIEQEIESVVSNPAVAPFVSVVETELTTVLTKYGVPVAELEAAGTAILSALNSLALQATQAVAADAGTVATDSADAAS